MTLDQYRTIIRALVPGAKVSVVSNSILEQLINMGVDDVNAFGCVYCSDKKFDVEAEKQTYAIHTYIDDFLMPAKGGLWWNDGDSDNPDWKRLDGMTRESINSEYPRWLNDDSDSPLRYIIENDNLIIHPKPNTTLTNGFHMFHVKKAVWMTDGSHYPFTGSDVEIANYSILDDAIIDYVRWKLAEPLGKVQKGVIKKDDYIKNRNEKIDLLKTRLDISSTPGARMRGPTIG